MDVKVTVKNSNMELLKETIPRILKIEKENPGVVVHVEAEIG